MTKTSGLLRGAALGLALGVLAGCGSSDRQSAAEEAAAFASEAAASGAKQPGNMAVAGPDSIKVDPGKPANHTAAHDTDHGAGDNTEATDENGNPIPAGPPQATEEDVRRALEEAENK